MFVHKRIKEGLTALWSVLTQCVLIATELPRGLVWSAQQRPGVLFNEGVSRKHTHGAKTGEKSNSTTIKVSALLMRVQMVASCNSYHAVGWRKAL